MEHRIRIFVGAYGSGKTEVAINYTLQRAAPGRSLAIADLDIVNPYFRSRELRAHFEDKGIEVVAPEGELANADLPIVTARVRACLGSAGDVLVFDVGGDDAGSRALSQFAPVIEPEGYDMFMVVNDRRPWTDSVQGIREAIARVQDNSRLTVTALVSNPNLVHETDASVVEQGHRLVLEASEALGLPVAFLCVMDELAPQIDLEALRNPRLLRMERHLLPPWYEDPLRHAPYHDRRAHVMAQEASKRKKPHSRG